MTLQIKYKAYVPELNKTVDVFAVNPMNHTVYLSHVQLFGTDGDDVLVRFGIELDDVKLRMFTTLLDMRGTEIYDGDILRYVSPEEEGPSYRTDIYEVEWRGFSFEARWANPPTPHWRSDGRLSLTGADEDMEVIGNKYENPELLEANL